MMKHKYFYYWVTDCEHEGDIESAKEEVVDAGGVIEESYWDGEDCGEAWIRFTIPSGKEEDVLKALGIYEKYFG